MITDLLALVEFLSYMGIMGIVIAFARRSVGLVYFIAGLMSMIGWLAHIPFFDQGIIILLIMVSWAIVGFYLFIDGRIT